MTLTTAADSSFRHVEWFASGVEGLDFAIGKGIPFGRITEISGQKGTAKTSLAFTILANAQQQGYQCAYADTERKASYEYAEHRGVDLKKLVISEADIGEDFVDDILEILEKGKHKVVIVDSIDGIVPKAIMEATAEQNTIGAKARLIAKLIRKAILHVQKKGIALILINQVRTDVMTGLPFTPGGKAVEFYEAVHVRLKQISRLEQAGSVVGIKIAGEVIKNQVGMPYRKFETTYLFKEGFSSEGDLLDAALNTGVLHKEKTTIMFGDVKLGVGLQKARMFLQENPELLAQIKEKMV